MSLAHIKEETLQHWRGTYNLSKAARTDRETIQSSRTPLMSWNCCLSLISSAEDLQLSMRSVCKCERWRPEAMKVTTRTAFFGLLGGLFCGRRFLSLATHVEEATPKEQGAEDEETYR